MKTNIDSVTFYRGGAAVTRSGVPDGQIVVIEGLPADVTENTLSVTAEGGAVTMTKVELADNAGTASETLEGLKKACEAAQAAVELNELAIEFCRQNLKVEGGTQALDAAFAYFTGRFAELLQARSQLKSAADAAKKRYEAFVAKAGAVKSTTAVIGLQGEPKRVWVRYSTRAAGWKLQREVHSDGKGQARFVLKAEAYNKSGEDFAGVAARFSASDPNVWAALPEFSPDYIGRPVNARVMARAAAPMMLAETASMPVEAETDVDVTYALDKLTLLSGESAGFVLKEETVPVEYRYLAPVYAVRQAYFTAEAKRPLPAGPVKVFYDGRFLGETAIPVDDCPVFGLGQAERIAVRRQEGRQFTAQKLIKGEVTEYRYTVSVRNDREQPVAVRVVDRVPVSTDKSIAVIVTQTTGAAYDEETGRLEWTVSLKPGASKELEVCYTVKNNN